MKIICAPDKFKESLSAEQAADAMARGIKRALPGLTDAQIERCPIADGGEGTVDALLSATGGSRRVSRVHGPLHEPVDAAWGLLPGDVTGKQSAVIEMAAASGLFRVPAALRDPTKTSTFGTGQLIKAALNEGVSSILIGIGGSATTDGGAGAAQALGVRFLGADNSELPSPMTGGSLSRVARIDLSQRDARLEKVRLTVACDVTNPLTGPRGAAHVYGPQKGATPAQVLELDAALARLARLLVEQHGIDAAEKPGAGAAGGLGWGLMAMLGATISPGIDLVLHAARFSERAAGAALCLTGEGRLDGQSLAGKACLGVARAAGALGVPTVALVGSLGAEAERTLEHGLSEYRVIGAGLAAEESMRRAGELLELATERLIRERLASLDSHNARVESQP
jgi:glycerate 2-kinase